MKRFVSILIICGACGYFGYLYWSDHRSEVEAFIQPVIAAVAGKSPAETTPIPEPAGDPQLSAREPVRQVAPPGVFYMLERVKMTKDSGVLAIVPGEEVRLMQRLPNGRLRVTSGRYDFVVRESQVTQDYDLAQAVRRNPGIAETLKQ